MNTSIIANKYTPMSKIGSGRFGSIYRGKYVKTGEDVAIKMEILDTEMRTLKHETSILNYLYSKGSINTPIVYWYGIYANNFTLVMPMYDLSLEDAIRKDKMSKIRVLEYASKMIDILETVHQFGVLHRDIKPQNFMLRNGDLFLIDFGLSTVYLDDKHNPYPPRPPSSYILGTPKFVSIHIHKGEDPSRRDDCISVIYILQYLLQDGHIQWENVQEDSNATGEYSENHILYHKNVVRKQIKEAHLESFDETNIIGLVLGHLYDTSYYDSPKYQWIRSLFLV